MASKKGARVAVLLVLLLLAIGYYVWATKPAPAQSITKEGGVFSLAELSCPVGKSLEILSATYGPETPLSGVAPLCAPLDVTVRVRELISKGSDFNVSASMLLTPAQLASAIASRCPSATTANQLVLQYRCA